LRGRVSGLVRLTEASGATAGRIHSIYLLRGEVVTVDSQARVLPLGEILRQRGLLDGGSQRQIGLKLSSGPPRRVGELLVEEYRISPDVVGAALRQQLRARLDALFRLEDATVSFHVACALPSRTAAPLSPREYLHGRPRARDRVPRAGRRRDDPPRRQANTGARSAALTLLGLDEDATLSEVSRAFRELAREVHPDRHAGASDAERRAMELRFAALSAAYHVLIG
ncbi:MAG TPA: J domain-containing protein, partial [Polyangiaceae bacterium]|nr:J domain-containing protein [Polyangiaceae bacterium]